MKRRSKNIFALLALTLALLPWQGALASEANGHGPVQTHLDARHPASLSGRMDRVQSGYVDLYAPLSPLEQSQLLGYRNATGPIWNGQADKR